MRALSSLQTLWKNRQLLWQFTVRQVELRHKGTHLGLVWSFLGPLLMVSLYVLVFGFIFRGRFQATGTESRIQYALVLFLGLALYHFIAEVVTLAPTVIVANPNFVKKVVFPLEILPAANVGAAAFHFCVTVGLIVLGAVLGGVPLHWGALWLPVIFLPLLLAGLGLGLGLSALGVFWRDIGQITQFLSLILLFASAVFYPVAQIPSPVWAVLKFNPLLHAIDQARQIALWGQPISVIHVVYLYVFGLGATAIGGTIFQRLRGNFSDAL